jgi:hypothetical protein
VEASGLSVTWTPATVPYATTSGAANDAAVYCMRGLGRAYAQPQVSVQTCGRRRSRTLRNHQPAPTIATSPKAMNEIHCSAGPTATAASLTESVPIPAIDAPTRRAGVTTSTGTTPMTTHAAASAPMGASSPLPTSRPRSVAAVRGRPRKTAPPTFAKQASARPPINASPATPKTAARIGATLALRSRP